MGTAPDDHDDEAGAPTIPVRRTLGEDVAVAIDSPGESSRLPIAGSRFEDRGEIGRGGGGEVRRVFDRVMHREVAMKRMRPETAGLRQSLEEAQVTGQLEHPNIVPVHDLGIDPSDGSIYYIMQLLRGRSFEDEIRTLHREAFDPNRLARVVRVVVEICDALSFAHERGVIHCDVKPSNVMVGRHGQVYLMDWGLSRVLAGDSSRRHAPPIGGTPGYMAPEQVSPKVSDVGPQTDVFGVGAILYRILTGKSPRVGSKSRTSVHSSDIDWALGPIDPPAESPAWKDLPPRLCEIAMKALSLDPADRYVTIDEIRAELEAFLHGGAWFATRSFLAGETLIREGDQASAALRIVSGRCEVYRERSGQRETIRVVGPGEVVGEMALLTDGPRSASVVAMEAGSAQVITRHSLDRELPSDGWIKALVSAIAERYRELDEELRTQRDPPIESD